MQPLSRLEGYRILYVPLSKGSPLTRQLMVKRNDQAADPAEWPNERTLFVAHLDYWVTEKALTRLFEVFGDVERVRIKKAVKPAQTSADKADGIVRDLVFGHVLFVSEDSMKNVLESPSASMELVHRGLCLPLARSVLKTAEKSALPASSQVSTTKTTIHGTPVVYCDPLTLQRHVDVAMAEHEDEEAAEKRRQQEPEVDEDGFTVVRGTGVTRSADGLAVKGYRVPTAVNTAVDYGELFGGIGHGTSQQRKLEKKKAKKQQVMDFYRFQHRERKRAEFMEEQKRNTRDQETVSEMKRRRLFEIR
ncbi:Ribosomal RNA-processing protein 7 A [Perkinsus olseni]|uniref:Ribosomal RNA-processing protein 7 A n=1 Tax=Perkinsus olseni TaxID=32597 RepID=A0A7J6L0S6_PEROL|nr:Ribosomal RNA-processing protein 7 A [Perkinsus olseni]